MRAIAFRGAILAFQLYVSALIDRLPRAIRAKLRQQIPRCRNRLRLTRCALVHLDSAAASQLAQVSGIAETAVQLTRNQTHRFGSLSWRRLPIHGAWRGAQLVQSI